jgi:tRNA (cytidine/uridine-2'-O-)-methyltransferase
VFRILFYHPEIPPNTGNAIRLAANTGCELHLIEPLGFNLEDKQLRRAGLDYHDLARVHVHADLDAAWRALLPAKVYAFSAAATRLYTDVAYAPGDVLLFGPESVGLRSRSSRPSRSPTASASRCSPRAAPSTWRTRRRSPSTRPGAKTASQSPDPNCVIRDVTRVSGNVSRE